MSDGTENSSTALSPSEEAFFESGGTADHGLQDDQPADEAYGGAGAGGQQQGDVQNDGQADQNGQQQVEQTAKPERTVPLAALHQARAEIREHREKVARLEQAFQRVMQLQGQGQQQQLPDPLQDPVGHFEARSALLEQQIQQIHEQRQQEQQQTEQQRQVQHFETTVKSVERQFAAATPDYEQATDFLKQSLIDNFVNQGYSNEEAMAGMQQQVRGMVHNFLQLGLNPAEMAYTIAKSRGYQGKAAAVADQSKASGDKIAQINKGQTAARSLSTAGGAGKPAITLEALAEMDPDELEKNWDQVKKFM